MIREQTFKLENIKNQNPQIEMKYCFLIEMFSMEILRTCFSIGLFVGMERVAVQKAFKI